MKNFILYGHGGSYNHGAEAITKMTIRIIREKYADAYIVLSSHFPAQDAEFSIDADEIIAPKANIWELEKQAAPDEKERLAGLMYTCALETITPDTTLLSVGGDNFCYSTWYRLAVFQREAKRKGARSILWGCSIEPSNVTPKMIGVFSTYDIILARESITYNALLEWMNTASKENAAPNVRLLPDIAFGLVPEAVELPTGFHEKNIVGINISPLVMRREAVPGIVTKNALELASYVLTKTDMNIALIPHVVMPMDDDYAALAALYQILPEKYKSRVWLVSGKLSAAGYKYIISKCRALICSRTHASIAAYSTGVPVFVAGYSNKSAGIALDLEMSEYVTDISSITETCVFAKALSNLLKEETGIRQVLFEKNKLYGNEVPQYGRYI
jgi:polysaccharide pyruvyl transferase WcaK-like protein